MPFLMGLFLGMAIIAVIGFIAMIGVVMSDKSDNAIIAQNVDANTNDDAAANNDTNVAPTALQLPAVTDSDHYKGDKNAKVVLVEYTDFECPYCVRHHETIKKIIEAYGNKIKYVQRHFPLSFHANAQKAAEAAECAGEQGKYFEIGDLLFLSNVEKTMNVDKFKELAKGLGLNTSKFNTCLDSGKYADKIKAVADGGAAAGVDGTPATFINGQLVSGALPFENFKSIIDGLLK